MQYWVQCEGLAQYYGSFIYYTCVNQNKTWKSKNVVSLFVNKIIPECKFQVWYRVSL